MVGTSALSSASTLAPFTSASFFSAICFTVLIPLSFRMITVWRDQIGETEADEVAAVVGARHAGGGEVDAVLLQGGNALGIDDRDELHADAEAPGDLRRKINVIADDLAVLARGERRRRVAVADEELAPRLDLVKLVGGGAAGDPEQECRAQQ